MSKAATIKSLLSAIAEDLISIPVPVTSTAKLIAGKCVPSWLKGDYYLLWDDVPRIIGFYSGEQGRLLRFRLNTKAYVIPQILEIDNIDSTFSIGSIRFRTASDPYLLDSGMLGLSDALYKKYRWFLWTRLRKYYNGQLLRLSSFTLTRNGVILDSQPVFYESVCRTNLILDAREKAGLPSIRETVQGRGLLEPLASSQLANPLGVNFLLFTADGRAVLPKRSRRVVVRPTQLSPSFSGDFEYTDAGSGALRKGVLIREGFEEINLLEGHIKKEKVWFLGLTRELVRGGKPEMFFIAHTSLTAREYRELHRTARDKYEFASPRSWIFCPFGEAALKETLSEDDKYSLKRTFEDLLINKGNSISVPLLTNLVLWLRQRLGTEFDG